MFHTLLHHEWRQRRQWPMFDAMFRPAQRFARPLAFLIVAAQLLVAVPAMATTHAQAGDTAEIPCDDMTKHGGDDPCPCCPDGAGSMTDCTVSCLLAASMPPTLMALRAEISAAQPFPNSPSSADTFSEPPLKPPPIA